MKHKSLFITFYKFSVTGNLVNPTTGNTAYVHYYSCGQCDYCQAEEYNCGQCGYCYEEYIVEEERIC